MWISCVVGVCLRYLIDLYESLLIDFDCGYIDEFLFVFISPPFFDVLGEPSSPSFFGCR